MKRYAVLNGFGMFDESKTDYKGYLDRFVRFVERKRIDEVVLCGGHTSPDHPEKSESGTMAEYIGPRLGRVRINIEDISLTTTQNLMFAKQFIDLGLENRVFVIADSVRFPKIMWVILSDWFGLDKQQAADFWLDLGKKVYLNPSHRGKPILLKDIRKELKYKNVSIVVDGLHKNKDALHTLVTEPLEILALYDKDMEVKFGKYSWIS